MDSYMKITRAVDVFRPNIAAWNIALTVLLVAAVAGSEALLFFGRLRYALWAYALLLVGLSLGPVLYESETPLFQALILLPLFRLVNLTMPIFIELSLFWLPLVYGPFILAVVYLGWRHTIDQRDEPVDASSMGVSLGHELPWWLGGDRSGKIRRLLGHSWQVLAPPADAARPRTVLHRSGQMLFALLVPVVVVGLLVGSGTAIVHLAEYEYSLITPTPLIPTLTANELWLLVIVMIVFVGFAEELLFRAIIQKMLERRLGLVPGLVLASGVFGVMHAGYGVQMEMAFAAGFGLLLGIVYDATDSIVLVSVMHGSLNVLVFGVIPLDGGSAVDLVRAAATGLLRQYDIWWLVEEALGLWAGTGFLYP